MMWEREHYLWNRKWLWILIILGAGLFLSYLQPLEMPEGGAVTFLSMLAVCMIGYFYGGWTGLLAALIFGVIQFLLFRNIDGDKLIPELFVYFPPKLAVYIPELFDYILGYGLLGAAGFLYQKKIGLRMGYLLAVLLRYIESVWNCSYFYHETVGYSLVYSSYIIVELVVTLLILCIPQVREAIEYLKYVATHKYEEDLDTF